MSNGRKLVKLKTSEMHNNYTAGVEIVEDMASGVSSWQVLCCSSDSVHIRSVDCIDTKFLNDIKRMSSFSSGAQVIRKWQAIQENDDLRWWLQLCPIDVIGKKGESMAQSAIRARRQIPWEWSRGRFPPIELNPVFMDQERLNDRRRMRLFENTNQVNVFPGSGLMAGKRHSSGYFVGQMDGPMSKLSVAEARRSQGIITTPPSTAPSTTVRQAWDDSDSAFVTDDPLSSDRKEDGALDYYDAYDENFDKAKHEGKGGLLSGVSDFLQNLQDGLSIAQAALPSNSKLVFTTASTTPLPSILLSRDANSLTIGVENDEQKRKVDSVVKIQRYGPKPQRPTDSEKHLAKLNLGDPRAIQQMLQFFGLCKMEL